MNNPSDPTDAPAPIPQSPPPAGDNTWLSSLLYADGSAIVDYGDGILLIDEKPPYGKG
jgi:hypothetical protein